MRIPRRVNTAWDWVDRHVSSVWAVVIAVIAFATAQWLPGFAAFALGAAGGAILVRMQMARQVARLRAEADELLRENGALRHEKTVLASGVISAQSVLTQRLPVIRDGSEEPARNQRGSEPRS